MQRRKFLTQTLPTTLLAAPAIFSSGHTGFLQNVRIRKMSPRIEAVKLAMLAMQRDAWEQGTAAQALLEMGENDLAVLMAKEAVVRQLEDGRLAVISSNCGSPNFDSPGTATEGQAFFLLMETAAADLENL